MNDFQIEATELAGCYKIRYRRFDDHRGYLAKQFRADAFQNLGLDSVFVEHFHSVSRRGVLRGMHFQRSPFECAKLIHVTYGVALDVIVDVRKESPTYGRSDSFTLDATQPIALYLPPGIAHGFYAPDCDVVMNYCYSAEYMPAYDTGIRWNSFGFDWPTMDPVLSDRDRTLPLLEQL